MTTFHAQPYNLDANGFFFTDLEDYEAKANAARDSFGFPVEEFELQFIDGDQADAQLFEAARVNQATLSQFLEAMEEIEDYQKPALYFLLERGYGFEEAIDSVYDVMLQEGNLEEAARQLFDEIYLYQIPEAIQPYIDYEAFARDCDLSGDFEEFQFAGSSYVCTNANGI